ncbi:MAG: T9SS type A sorting domain-containing protein [Calditrichaeota bacterium]|nr:T9SS type A sorting domain-containing protein [Calditrichota bacterium]
MKRNFTIVTLVVLGFFLTLGMFADLLAQDTLDVAQGYETLNVAVESDTVSPNPNRVYRLARGGVYLLNGTIKDVGVPIRIVAAKGNGPKPLLIMTADESGESSRYFRPGEDGEWRGLYISGIDNLGNQTGKNTWRIGKEDGRYVIDNCIADGDAQSFIRMDADGQKLFITNSIFSNSFRLSSPGNGRFLDTRGNTQDTIFVQNCTFFNGTGDVLRNGGGIVKYIVFDHVTIEKAIGLNNDFEFNRNVYCQFTNNLLHDMGWEGRDLMSVDSISGCIMPVDSLNAPEIATEEQRKYIMKNNVMGWSPEIRNWIESKDSLQLYPWTDAPGEFFFSNFSNFMFENNIIEDVVFSDGPDATLHLAYIEHRYNDNYLNNNNPDIRLDRNGVGTLTDNPETFGPASDEYDFDYADTFAAYTHAVGGFPVGDLNWFPAKKAEWEAAGSPMTGVHPVNKMNTPAQFELEQNFPNPFNPTTSIVYQLNTEQAVTLGIYNMLGQKVRTLVSNQVQTAGSYKVQWDGCNEVGVYAPSGVYFYRLQAGDKIQSRKMLLIK